MLLDGMQPTLLERRIEASIPALPLAEQRMARFFLREKQATVLGSAAQIAEHAGTSDATVVRTARSLGFAGLSDLRAALLADLVTATAPHERLRRTLVAAGNDGRAILTHVLGIHRETLAVFESEEISEAFERSLKLLASGGHRYIFGIGPSGAVADYATLQFNRIGLRSASLNASGIALADRLLPMAGGDALLVIAYAPIYREVVVTLERARVLGVPVVLISDSLGPTVGHLVREVLPVPRGRAGNLAMHGGTIVLVEALVAGLAAGGRSNALESLGTLSDLRGALDKTWSRRGLRRGRGDTNAVPSERELDQ
jgi:DNA-binding MurR/RpiR family transcriptional regulator